MSRTLFAATLGFGTLILCADAAFAQSTRKCGPRDKVVEVLANKYNETRRAIGLATQGRVMETFASESGSWTVVITMPNGLTCLVASGQSFESTGQEVLVPQGTAL